MKNSIVLGVLLTIALLIKLNACSGHDSEYMPYALTGLDVYVYNNYNDKEYYGGRIKANYFTKNESLSEAASLAYSIAQEYHLKDWSYVCCTVTPWSDCATKVR